MRVFKLISFVMLLGHWNGCLQFLVPMLQGFPADSWVAINELEHAGPDQLYTWALFKALSHMLSIGYGRFPPQNKTDVWLTIISIMTGATCYALLVGHATSVIQSSDTSKKLYRQKYKHLEEYMSHRRLPQTVRTRLADYYENRYHGQVFHEEQILSELNDTLKEEIVTYNSKALVSTVPFFRYGDPYFVSEIVAKLQHEVFQPGNFVMKEDSKGDKMYFIQEGSVDIMRHGEVLTTLSTGSYFGEICLLTNCKRVASVKTETYCNLYSLSKDHLLSTLELHPLMKLTMEKVAAQRLYKAGIDKETLAQHDSCDESVKKLRDILLQSPPFGSRSSVHSLDSTYLLKRRRGRKHLKYKVDRQPSGEKYGGKESSMNVKALKKSRSASSKLETVSSDA